MKSRRGVTIVGMMAVATLLVVGCGSRWLAGGKLHFDQKRYDRALENFEKAKAEQPMNGEVRLWLGRALAELDRDEEAVVELKQASELDPLQSEMVTNTLLSYWSRRFNDALALAKEADGVRQTGDQAKATQLLGDAENRFRRAIIFAPDSVGNYSNLGKVLYQLGRRDEAMQMFHKTKEMSAGRPDLQRSLFLLFKSLGEEALQSGTRAGTERALQFMMDASDIPMDAAEKVEVNFNLGLAYYLLADSVSAELRPQYLQHAIDYNTKVLEVTPDDPDALENIAYAYSALGQNAPAIAAGQRRLDMEPWSKDLHVLMYRLQRAANDQKAANGHLIFAQIMEQGSRQPAQGIRQMVTSEFGPMSDMLEVLRDRGEPEEVRMYTGNFTPFYAWYYWTEGRVFIFQGGEEKFRFSFKAVPRDKVKELLR